MYSNSGGWSVAVDKGWGGAGKHEDTITAAGVALLAAAFPTLTGYGGSKTYFLKPASPSHCMISHPIHTRFRPDSDSIQTATAKRPQHRANSHPTTRADGMQQQ